MIRTFLKRSLAASAVVAGGGTAYVLSDKRARRSLSFWTKIGPIVGSYVSTGVSFKYLRAKEREENKAKWKADRSAAFGKLHEENAPKVLQAIIQLRGIVSQEMYFVAARSFVPLIDTPSPPTVHQSWAIPLGATRAHASGLPSRI